MDIELICESCIQYIGIKYKISSEGNEAIIKRLVLLFHHNDLQCTYANMLSFHFSK